MEAFLTKHKISELRSILEDKSDHIALSNTWLLSPSLHKAFRYGQVRILPRSNPQWEDKDERLVTTDKQSKVSLFPGYCAYVSSLYLISFPRARSIFSLPSGRRNVPTLGLAINLYSRGPFTYLPSKRAI